MRDISGAGPARVGCLVGWGDVEVMLVAATAAGVVVGLLRVRVCAAVG